MIKHVFMGKEEKIAYMVDGTALINLINLNFYLKNGVGTCKKASKLPEDYICSYKKTVGFVELETNNNIQFPLIKGDIYLFNNKEYEIEKVVINPDGSITCYIDYSVSIEEDLDSKREAIKEAWFTMRQIGFIEETKHEFAKRVIKKGFWETMKDVFK
jgi:hypothetical protein